MRRKVRTIAQVLELKERKREEIAVEVKEIQDRIGLHEAALVSLERNYLMTLSKFDGMQRGSSVAAHSVGLYYGYLHQLLGEMESRKERISRCLVELGERREALVEALKETRVYETLKDRRERECEQEEAVRERKEMDFLAVSRRAPG